jgi:hypothetical protein
MSTISPTSYKLAFLQFCRNSSSRSGIPPNQQATTEVWWVESEVLIVFCRLLLAINRAIKRAIADIKIGIHVDLNSSIEPLINRKPGLSKTLINQLLIGENGKRVIFRVIERKL